MHLDDRAVHGHRFNLDTHELGTLQLLKNLLQHAFLSPATQPRVNRMPITKSLWQAAPLATVLGDVKHGIEYIQIRDIDVAALRWQAMFDPLILFCADFHAYIVSRRGAFV